MNTTCPGFIVISDLFVEPFNEKSLIFHLCFHVLTPPQVLSTKAPGLEKNSFEGNIVCVCSYVHRYGILWVYPTLTAQHKSINQVCTGQLRPNRFKYIVKRIFHVVKAQVLNLEVVTCQCSVSYIVTRNNRPICIKKFNYLLPVSCNN